MFPDEMPNWTILLGAAVVTAVLSVIVFGRSKNPNE